MYTSFTPNSMVQALIALVFYVLTGGFVIYSFLALYALNKYGRSKTLTTAVTVFYLIVMASLFASAQTNLIQINYK